jgi:hypothetical protein
MIDTISAIFLCIPQDNQYGAVHCKITNQLELNDSKVFIKTKFKEQSAYLSSFTVNQYRVIPNIYRKKNKKPIWLIYHEQTVLLRQ